VEGFEYEVLLGCQKSFEEKRIKNIICEIHSKYLKNRKIDEQKIYSLLRENHFIVQEVEKHVDTKHILATLKL